MIRHAIIGCGRVSPWHIEAFKHLRGDGVELVACCDIIDAKCKHIASQYNIPIATTDYRVLYEDAHIDSISIALPHHLHFPLAKEGIAKGKHILIEKPFVINAKDASSLISAAQENKIVLQPISQHRFDTIIIIIKDIIQKGYLGSICMVRGHLECTRESSYYLDSPWRGKWETEGGSVLINQAYHIVDLLMWLAGPIRAVSAVMTNLSNQNIMETEDALVTNLVFQNKALGSLTVNGASGATWNSYIEICGTSGAISFDISYPNSVHRFELNNDQAYAFYKKQFDCHSKKTLSAVNKSNYYGASHFEEAKAFIERIRGKSLALGSSPKEAMAVVLVINSIYDSARKMQWCSL